MAMIDMWKLGGRLGNQMFQYAYIYSKMRDGFIPDIYVQSEKYFKRHAEEIRFLFGAEIHPIDQVSIHVRRGDYVGNSFYVNLSNTGYYEKAMAKFPNADFLVFSDDIEWCKGQDIFKDCEFANGNEVDDLNLMASCKHNIIANSSFSWWAAYLNPNPDKIVIAPKQWYTDGFERTTCPEGWIRI